MRSFIILLSLICTLFFIHSSLLSQENIGTKSLNWLLKDKHSDSLFDQPIRLPEDKSDNRMILAPTGRTIKQGQVQIASMVVIPYLAMPTIHAGITDYINVGFGISVPTGLFYFAPKVRFLKTGSLSMSAGMLWCPKQESSSFESFSIAYIAASIGNEKASLNIGVGYNFTEDLFEKKPIVQVGGDVRLGKGLKLISENWIIVGETIPILSAGFRAFYDFINFDLLAVFVPSKDFPLPFYPIASVGFNFDVLQKKK
jgi:hypothetical protein